MNIYGISDILPAIEEIGHTLDNPQRMKLQMGLIRLTDIADADQLLFWGKIFTNNQPYYIAMGVDFKGYYAFPHKKFYYCTNNFIFEELPALDQFNKQKANNYTSQPFTGDPTTILFNIQGEQGQQKIQPQQKQQVDSDQQQVVKIVPKNFTELDRLSYTVKAIEIQCQLAPIGGFKMSLEHELRYNQSFKGLNPKDIKLCHFMHFRYPIKDKNAKKMENANSVLKYDFLEPIQNQTHWCIQKNIDQNIVTVRSFLWPGYAAYHKINTKVFGGYYFGNGIKRTDISFYV